jgi:class I fructose-bisphosphate aldolase
MDKILNNYLHESPAIRGNLFRLLNHGALSGTGKLLILPVDQGMEHGPDASFLSNHEAYDPLYHVELALEAELSGYAAPLGMLEVAAARYPGRIPMILKMNSSNSLKNKELAPYQALIADLDAAQNLGCIGIGMTLYPGSDEADHLLEVIAQIFHEAKKRGLITVLWSYPRGTDDDTALDTIAYGTHMAALLGAHIIKVKIPTSNIMRSDLHYDFDCNNLSERIKHIKRAGFNGKRLVIFSGGNHKGDDTLLKEIYAIKDGGGDGSIIGRNLFQRPRNEALALAKNILKIYK